jgi:heme-degrading monooxygenase HmoA
VLRVQTGDEEAFEESARQALPIIESAPGCHGAEFRRQEEDPSVYRLLVRWDSVEVHMAFRETDLYTAWRKLTHPFYVGALDVTHFHEPIER